MVNVHIVIGMIILQIYVNAAPSDISKLEDIAKLEVEGPRLDSEAHSLEKEIKNDNESSQGQRQKRFYNYYGYGFPPINPLVYPGYNKRDQSADVGVYGSDDTLSQIHRRLQEIANVVRQTTPPPPASSPYQFPFFFPIIFIPQSGCACNPETNTKPQTPTSDSNQTTPGIFNRFPEIDDVRQNWGFVTNVQDADDGEDFSRPISFDPIIPDTPMSRPPPSVEHGSSQASSQGNTPTTTTLRPNPPNNVGQSAPYPPSFGIASSKPNDGAPSTCDKAVLSCCHQLQVTYNCFALQGCPDPTSYGNPCDPKVILRIIERFQKFYGQRNG